MIISYTLSEKEVIPFIRVEILMKEGKTKYYNSQLQLDEESLKIVNETHRIYLPCKIIEDEMCILNVPEFWNCESIENYIQAFLDEIMLQKKGFENSKTEEELIRQFSLEILVF